MRLFIALELPADVRSKIAALGQRLASQLPKARWVARQGLHLTLEFLGEVDPARLPGLDAALRPVFARYRPLALAVAGGGTFPPRRPARVAWLAVEAPAELATLQGEVAAAAGSTVDLRPAGRPFHAHVTVARPARPWSRRDAERFTAAAAGSFGPPFTVEDGVLFESRLGPGGARYQALERWPLQGEAGG